MDGTNLRDSKRIREGGPVRDPGDQTHRITWFWLPWVSLGPHIYQTEHWRNRKPEKGNGRRPQKSPNKSLIFPVTGPGKEQPSETENCEALNDLSSKHTEKQWPCPHPPSRGTWRVCTSTPPRGSCQRGQIGSCAFDPCPTLGPHPSVKCGRELGIQTYMLTDTYNRLRKVQKQFKGEGRSCLQMVLEGLDTYRQQANEETNWPTPTSSIKLTENGS